MHTSLTSGVGNESDRRTCQTKLSPTVTVESHSHIVARVWTEAMNGSTVLHSDELVSCDCYKLSLIDTARDRPVENLISLNTAW